MRTTQFVSLAAAVGIATLLVFIVYSSLEMPLIAGLQATVDTRWGVTTMADLYVGLLVIAGWIAYRERSIPRTLAWVVGLCLLGNLVTLIYVLISSLRAKSVEDLFRPVPR